MNRKFSGPLKEPPTPSRRATHEHEWKFVETVFEDDSAILIYKCRWVEILDSSTGPRGETYYKEGAECDRQKRDRFDVLWVEKKTEDYPNIRFYADETSEIIMEKAMESTICHGETVSFDPDSSDDHVIVESDSWRVKYTA